MTDSQRTIVQAKSHECGQASSFSSVASWLGLYSHVTYYSPKGCEFAQNCNQLIYLGSKPFNLKYNNLQSLLATVVMDHKLEWAHDMKLIYLQCMIGFFFFFSFPPHLIILLLDSLEISHYLRWPVHPCWHVRPMLGCRNLLPTLYPWAIFSIKKNILGSWKSIVRAGTVYPNYVPLFLKCVVAFFLLWHHCLMNFT